MTATEGYRLSAADRRSRWIEKDRGASEGCEGFIFGNTKNSRRVEHAAGFLFSSR